MESRSKLSIVACWIPHGGTWSLELKLLDLRRMLAIFLLNLFLDLMLSFLW